METETETAYSLYPDVRVITDGYNGGYLVKWYDATADVYRVYEVPKAELEILILRLVTRSLFHGTVANNHPDAHNL